MLKFVIILLVLTSGCAAVRPSESVAPVVPPQSVEVREPIPTQSVEKADLQSGVAPQAPHDALPPAAPEPSRPTASEELASIPHASSSSPHKILPKPATLSQTTPVPDYKLHGLVELAEKNDEKIMNVFVGMYRKTVEGVMGTAQNPYKHQTIMGANGQAYEVLFYLTREPRKGKPISDRMLTPVIFKQGRVAGIGAYQLKKLLRTGSLDRQKSARGVLAVPSSEKPSS